MDQEDQKGQVMDQKGQEDQVMDHKGKEVNKMGYVVEEDLVKIVDQVNHGVQKDLVMSKALVVNVMEELLFQKVQDLLKVNLFKFLKQIL